MFSVNSNALISVKWFTAVRPTNFFYYRVFSWYNFVKKILKDYPKLRVK